MKPAFSATCSRDPQGAREQEAAEKLLQMVTLVFGAKVGIEKPIPQMKDQERIMLEVSRCSRMVAFLTFHGSHASVEITFSERKTVIKILRFSYYFNQHEVILVAELK